MCKEEGPMSIHIQLKHPTWKQSSTSVIEQITAASPPPSVVEPPLNPSPEVIRLDEEPAEIQKKEVAKRRSFSYEFKNMVLDELMEEHKHNLSNALTTIAQKHELNTDQVLKWSQAEEKIRKYGAARVTKVKKSIGSGRTPLYPDIEKPLKEQIVERRSKGLRVSTRFVVRHAKQLAKEHYPEEQHKFKASTMWLNGFAERESLTIRVPKNTKVFSTGMIGQMINLVSKSLMIGTVEMIPPVKQFHLNLRDFLKTGVQQDPIYGRFKPENRYNVDQIIMK